MANNFTLQDGSGLLSLQGGSGLFTLQSASNDVIANASFADITATASNVSAVLNLNAAFNGILAVAPTATAVVVNSVIAHASFASIEASSIAATVTVTSASIFGDTLASNPEASANQSVSASFNSINASGATAVSIVSSNATIKAIELAAPNAHAQSDTVAVVSIAALSLSAPSASVSIDSISSFRIVNAEAPTGFGHADSVTAFASFAQLSASNPTATALIEYPIHKTIIRQYEESPIINAMVNSYAQTIDAKYLFDSFYTNIWNIDTANSQGLDIWGRIVGVSRYLTLQNSDYFGFDPDFAPFDNAPFFGGSVINDQYRLSNDDFRRVIKAKALANITGTTIPWIELVLQQLFSVRGKTKVRVAGFKELDYVFKFDPTDLDNAIITAPNLLPIPAGHTINKLFEP